MSFLPFAPRPIGTGEPEEYPNPNAELAWQDVTLTFANVETDARAITTQIFNEIAARAPGWAAHDGNLETWLVESFATVAAQLRADALDVPGAIFREYGQNILNIPPRLASSAIGYSRWQARDGRGYTISPGTQIVLERTGDELIAFEVVEGAVIEPSRDPTGELDPDTPGYAEDVLIRALDPGVHANGLAGLAEVVDPLFWVQRVEVRDPTFRGEDGQTTEQYTNELAMLMRIIALRPILPADYAILTLHRIPGVARAIALDGYEPSNRTWNHQRQITLLITDLYGQPLPDEVKDDVRAMLESLREVNFRVIVTDCDYQTVDVDFECTAFIDQNPEFVQEACVEALRNMLHPANWRLGTTSPAIAAGEVIPPPGITGMPPGRMTIRRHDIIGLLDRVRGVDWVDEVTIDGVPMADARLRYPTTLPRPGEITGTVNPA